MDDDDIIQTEFSWRRAPVLLADRLGVRPAGLLGGLLAVVAAACGAWWALRPPPPPAEEVLPFVQTVFPAPAVSGDAGSTTLPAIVVVHVDGAVLHPGIHELRVGARVADAIDAAGGLALDADRHALNLAQVLGDGQRIWVPRIGEEVRAAVVTGGTDDATGNTAGGPVSLSTATPAMLKGLPGTGPRLVLRLSIIATVKAILRRSKGCSPCRVSGRQSSRRYAIW